MGRLDSELWRFKLRGSLIRTFPYFFPLVTSRTYSIRLTANLRAQIDSGDTVGYLTILLASIVIEIIAIFCENNPILRKFDIFLPPVTSNLT